MSVKDARVCAVRDCPNHVEGSWRVCRSCSASGLSAVHGLPSRYAHLRAILRPGSALGEKVGGHGFESSSPIRDTALDTMDVLASWVIDADREVRGVLHMTMAPVHMREGKRLSLAAANLSVQWERVMPDPLAPMLASGARSLSRIADRVLGWDRLTHRLPAPCPYCDQLTLYRLDGQSEVRCGRCHRAWAETEYRHFVRMLVEEHA